ncbi:hypothetical protein OG758_09895 [Streptomyces sp. NBC_01474]|uniref:hypothetical protein n=1 Tax=unclassified Streptomyces TaxID=2593676 RepID=UPI002DDBE7DA|nr:MULTISPECIES: hypothetical protein [unclassified Streptomyces]WSD94447.1 hypothetical protein OG758_09895 [Streptomyces sp. NBC_01474]
MSHPHPPQHDIPPLPPTAPPIVLVVPKRAVFTAALLGLTAGAAIVGGAWGLTASSGPDKPGTFTLNGTFELTDSVVPDGDGGCAGTRGYDDISEGASVTVYSADGKVVAAGGLGKSTYDGDNYNCTYKVAVDGVPKGERFYKVEVSHRGTLQLSAEEAEHGGFAGSLG